MGDNWRASLDDADKIVRPRTLAAHPFLPVYAVDQTAEQAITERGEVLSLSAFYAVISRSPGSIIACHQAGRLLHRLDKRFESDPCWQFKVVPVRRELYTAPARPGIEPVINSTVVAFCGFRDRHRKANRYHYPLDPLTFHGKTINELYGEDDTRPPLYKLLDWAISLRNFCALQGVRVRPTAGGVAAALLRDPRWHREARRKVPRATNARAREYLPGNYYELRTREDQEHSLAVHIDQQGAHHYHAARIQFPHADNLYARGYFETLHDDPWKPWRSGSRLQSMLRRDHGLFYGRIECPHFHPGSFPLPFMTPGSSLAAFYSNELPYMESMGVRVRYLIAAWTSDQVDRTLNDYASWATTQTRETRQSNPRDLVWLKPTLLSTYGILASRPKTIEFGFKRATGGVPTQYPVGSGYIEALGFRTTRELEPSFANVIHRGMIEAATRSESLQMATEMTRDGHAVLSVYADAIFMEADTALPLLPPPWLYKGEVNRLRFINSTSFTSAQLTRLPGVARRDEVMRASRGVQHFPSRTVGVAPAREFV